MHYLPIQHTSAVLDMNKIIYDKIFLFLSCLFFPSLSSISTPPPPTHSLNQTSIKMCHPYSFCMRPPWKTFRKARSAIQKFFRQDRDKTTKQLGRSVDPCNSITATLDYFSSTEENGKDGREKRVGKKKPTQIFLIIHTSGITFLLQGQCCDLRVDQRPDMNGD